MPENTPDPDLPGYPEIQGDPASEGDGSHIDEGEDVGEALPDGSPPVNDDSEDA